MDDIIIIQKEQLAEVVYAAVNKCLDERKVEESVSRPDDEEGYYDRNEICKLLHIAYPTLWRLEQQGILTHLKIGRKNLYSKVEVNKMMKSGKLAKYNRK